MYCLDYRQVLPNRTNKFQDGDSSWQLYPMLCIVHPLCCSIGKQIKFKFYSSRISRTTSLFQLHSLQIEFGLQILNNYIAYCYVLVCQLSKLILRNKLNYRKESSFNLGSAETKLLYTLHWILLEAADECALAMGNEGKLDSSPFAYLFPVTAITVSLKIGTIQVINNDCCGIFYTYL